MQLETVIAVVAAAFGAVAAAFAGWQAVSAKRQAREAHGQRIAAEEQVRIARHQANEATAQRELAEAQLEIAQVREQEARTRELEMEGPTFALHDGIKSGGTRYARLYYVRGPALSGLEAVTASSHISIESQPHNRAITSAEVLLPGEDCFFMVRTNGSSTWSVILRATKAGPPNTTWDRTVVWDRVFYDVDSESSSSSVAP